MGVTNEDRRRAIEDSVESFRAALTAGLDVVPLTTLTDFRAQVTGREAADFVLRDLPCRSAADTVAERIGPVYSLDDLAAWIEGGGVTAEAIRQRCVRRSLVAFRTVSGQWAVPAWQFRPAGGQLHVLDGVVTLWRSLPHDESFLTDADLAAWMATRMRSLAGSTPATWAAAHGLDERLASAVDRLVARAA